MSKYYLIKECNNIPFILGQFDSIEEAEAALPSTNKKGAKHFVVCSTEQLKSARAAISYLQEELRKSREEVRQWRDLELKTRLDFSNQICELSKISPLFLEKKDAIEWAVTQNYWDIRLIEEEVL